MDHTSAWKCMACLLRRQQHPCMPIPGPDSGMWWCAGDGVSADGVALHPGRRAHRPPQHPARGSVVGVNDAVVVALLVVVVRGCVETLTTHGACVCVWSREAGGAGGEGAGGTADEGAGADQGAGETETMT